MAKTDHSSQGEYGTPPPLGLDQKALVAALTAAIVASRQDRRPPSTEALAAATQYGDIKRALRTLFES